MPVRRTNTYTRFQRINGTTAAHCGWVGYLQIAFRIGVRGSGLQDLKDYEHPIWSANLRHAISVLNDDGRISLPDMVYVAPIKRYLFLTWRF